MSDDLVKRLREGAQWQFKTEPTLYGEAADRIEQLETALRQIAETPDHYTAHMVRTHARVALGEKKDG